MLFGGKHLGALSLSLSLSPVLKGAFIEDREQEYECSTTMASICSSSSDSPSHLSLALVALLHYKLHHPLASSPAYRQAYEFTSGKLKQNRNPARTVPLSIWYTARGSQRDPSARHSLVQVVQVQQRRRFLRRAHSRNIYRRVTFIHNALPSHKRLLSKR